MGGGIAMNFANAGIPVAILEVSGEALERGLAVIRKNYGASVARGSLAPARAEQALALIRGVSDYQALSGADIQMSFVGEMAKVFGKLEAYPRLGGWLARMHARPAFQRSLEKGGPYRFAK